MYRALQLTALFLLTSRVVFAQTTFVHIIDVFAVLISGAAPVAFGLAMLFFFWGLAQYITRAGDSKSNEEGRDKMLWGIIALFVISSVWGIIFWAGLVFGLGQGGTCPPPQIGATSVTTCF